MKIRFIEPDELPQLLELYQFLNPEDPVVAVSDSLKTTWQAIIEDPKLYYFVAEQESRLVGTCMLAIIPNLTRGVRPFGIIQNVVSHPDHRGKGIGKRLLKAANEHAWQNNCYQVLLQTGRDDTHSFYQSAGFRSDVKTGFVAKPVSN